MSTPRPGWRRDERGQALVELVGVLPWLVLAALLALEMLLFVSTASAAEHAARNAGRVLRAEGDPYEAARSSVGSFHASALRPGDVRVDGEEVTVELRVPLVAPVLRTDAWTVSRSATFPVGDSTPTDGRR